VFSVPNDFTVYIEDRNAKEFRNDGRMTIYEHSPPLPNAKRLEEVRLHRCAYARIFNCTAPSDMQIIIIVLDPSNSKYLYHNTQFLELKQTSNIVPIDPNIELYPEFKKAKFVEIPIIGGQSFVIPKGWWVYIDSPAHIDVDTF
tara:strand:+ start:297 stop:728 length:432 start_codon:yes stop_codon:yes gene_type:complete